MAQVFISYAQEQEATARIVAEKLKTAGIDSWTSFNLKPGQLWSEEVARALGQARVFVLVFSAAANLSRFVRDETHYAFNSRNDITIIPFVVEDVTPTGLFDFIVNNRQWLRATPPTEEKYKELTEAVGELLSRQQPAPPGENRPSAGAKRSAKKSSKKNLAPHASAIPRPPVKPAKKGQSPSAAAPEALLAHIAATSKGLSDTSRRRGRPDSGALRFFLSFLGLRHGATADDVIALHGPCEQKPSASKRHFVLHYRAKGLSTFCDRETRKVSLIAAKMLDSAAWERWRRTQRDLKYLGKRRSYILREFGRANSKVEMSRLNPEILDYDFTGFRGRSGYVLFNCPARDEYRCVSMQVHWLH